MKRDYEALHGSLVEIHNEFDFKRVKDFINSYTSDVDTNGGYDVRVWTNAMKDKDGSLIWARSKKKLDTNLLKFEEGSECKESCCNIKILYNGQLQGLGCNSTNDNARGLCAIYTGTQMTERIEELEAKLVHVTELVNACKRSEISILKILMSSGVTSSDTIKKDFGLLEEDTTTGMPGITESPTIGVPGIIEQKPEKVSAKNEIPEESFHLYPIISSLLL